MTLYPDYTPVGLAIEKFDLERRLTSKQWEHLTPNFPNDQDLDPVALTADKVIAIAEAALGISTSGNGDYAEKGPFPNRFGEDRFSKTVDTSDGRIMATIVSGRDIDFGVFVPGQITIPSLDNFTLINNGETIRLWEFNSARTYIQLPLTDGYMLQLQEHSGQIPERGGIRTNRRVKHAARTAVSQVRKEFVIDKQDYAVLKREMFRRDNFLVKDGVDNPLLLGVRFIERNLPGQKITPRVP